MPSSLTGDFDAVMQVSGKTIGRLIATMHQNHGTPKNLPTFPHSEFLRLGSGGRRVDGVVGIARAQLSTPRIELINGAQDRFVIRVWVRAHFTPDSGSAPFPQFINGYLRAEYRVREEYNNRYGRMIAAYVDTDGIAFTSLGPDKSSDAAITRQAASLLVNDFRMTPHPLKTDFESGRLRTLVAPDGTEAVTTALSLIGGAPAGRLDSVNTVLLAGRDLAVAVSREYIMSLVQPTLDALIASQIKVHVHVDSWIPFVPDVDTDYHVNINTASASWSTGVAPVLGVPGGCISLSVFGSATTPSVLPNLTFSIKHELWLIFDAPTESLALYSDGTPDVDVDVNGPFGWIIEGTAESDLTKQFNSYMTSAITTAKTQLAATGARKATLVSQLHSMDDNADAHFDSGEFTDAGVILRGSISVSPRQLRKVIFGKLADRSGFTAFPCWVPGGRIDDYHWRWFWFDVSPSSPVSPQYTQSHADRFLLQTSQSLPGLPPVPGSAESRWSIPGAVCLTYRGMLIHAVTGDEVPIDSSVFISERLHSCLYFYPPPPPPIDWWIIIRRRLLIRLYLSTGSSGGSTGGQKSGEFALMDVGTPRAGGRHVNTLIHYFDTLPDSTSLEVLHRVLSEQVREDAALAAIIVIREGLLGKGGSDAAEALARLARSAAAPVIVTEDVQGGWAARFGFGAESEPHGENSRGEASLLVSPQGAVAWRNDGPANNDELVAALREHLSPAPLPESTAIAPTVGPGQAAPDFYLDSAGIIHLRRLQGRLVVLCFVQPFAESSIARARRLERLASRQAENDARTIFVIDGVDQSGAEAFARSHSLSAPVVADPLGAVAERFDVRIWPATFRVDEHGIITGYEAGADPGSMAMLDRD